MSIFLSVHFKAKFCQSGAASDTASAARSGTMRLLATSWSMPGTLGLFYFALEVAWGAKTQPMEKK
jgi:hypothetical protein